MVRLTGSGYQLLVTAATARAMPDR
jgi:hypothetical protein